MNVGDKIKKVFSEVKDNTEWLSTTEGDEIECISVEYLTGIIKRIFKEEMDE